MKIAITANNPTLNADIDPRFGRCVYFIFVELDNMNFEAFPNPHASMGRGAGIQAAQFVIEKGAQSVLTGNCGPKAFQVLAAGGVQVVIDCTGNVEQVVNDYKAGKLKTTSQPNVQGHAGINGL